MYRRLFVLLTCLALAGCGTESATLGPESSTGLAQVFIGVQSEGVAGSVGASVLAGGAPPVDFSAIQTLELTIESLEVHRSQGAAWLPLEIETVTVDLAAIEEGSSEPIAAGGLPAGEYDNLRIFLSSATVTFVSDVLVGNTTFASGQPYELEIPGAANTGLKIPTAHFVVDGGSEAVVVLFDPSATSPSIGTTGSGRVRMTPVLREADPGTESEVAGSNEEGTDDSGEEEDSGEDETEGSGSASVLIGATGGVSASATAAGVSLANSVLPPGAGLTEDDIVSLRLVLCEIRAIRTGGSDSEPEDGDGAADGTAEDEGPGTEGDAEADETPACQGNAGGAAWTRIPLEATDVDLFALGDREFLEIAAGDVPAGSYRNVRLYLSEAYITFARDVSAGNRTYASGEEHALRIPSADNNGLRIPTSHFEIDPGGDGMLALVFDRSSVSSVKATGNGVRMSPILREADVVTEGEMEETGNESTSG